MVYYFVQQFSGLGFGDVAVGLSFMEVLQAGHLSVHFALSPLDATDSFLFSSMFLLEVAVAWVSLRGAASGAFKDALVTRFHRRVQEQEHHLQVLGHFNPTAPNAGDDEAFEYDMSAALGPASDLHVHGVHAVTSGTTICWLETAGLVAFEQASGDVVDASTFDGVVIPAQHPQVVWQLVAKDVVVVVRDDTMFVMVYDLSD